jgi:osmotically-inducible protein OsmY
MKMKTMNTDLQIQNDVANELNFSPILTGCEIGVSVTNDFVTLSGTVDTYAKKIAAENAAKRIACVKGVSLHINVTPSSAGRRSDSEIAAMTFNALKNHSELPTEKINVRVENGCVTLTGEVAWTFQKTAAYTTLQNLSGVRGIVNSLEVKPTLAPKQMTPTDIKHQINSAFHRSATINPGKINIETLGGKVVLTGVVGSWAEQREAEYLACSAPGVSSFENRLTVLPNTYASTSPSTYGTTNATSFALTNPVNFGFNGSEMTS